jgi:hypothetical protein
MAEIFPVDVIDRGAFVLYLFLGFDFASGQIGLIFRLVYVLGDLRTVFRNVLRLNVRLVAYPSRPTPTKEPVLNAMLHGRAEVWIMLNLKVQGAFNELRGYPSDGVVITEPA